MSGNPTSTLPALVVAVGLMLAVMTALVTSGAFAAAAEGPVGDPHVETAVASAAP